MLSYKPIAWLEQRPTVLMWATSFILAVVYLLDLGMPPIWADEPTRMIVALEMIIKGDYLVPTIHGDYYYNKPPLFNWLLVLLMKITGNHQEVIGRLAAVIPLFLFGATIFFWLKRHASKNTAFLAALMFLSCGRLLIYDAWLGHIDIFYAWLTFLSFIAIYHFFYRAAWLQLFVVSYFLAALGFMCKGLPSLLFQGLTLVALFTYERSFKKLFHPTHFAGLALFVLIVGGYFFLYNQENAVVHYFAALYDQAEQRTVVDKGWLESILYIFIFPFDNLFHLLPWSLLIPFLFVKGTLRTIWNNRFFKFILVVLLINLPPYWLSPDNRPRYLFMLYPLFFMLLAHTFNTYRDKLPSYRRMLEGLFFGSIAILALSSLALPFVPALDSIALLWPKSIALFLLFTTCVWLFGRLKFQRFVILGLALAIFRLGFNWMVFPDRANNSREAEMKKGAIEMAEMSGRQELFRMKNTPLNQHLVYYIERERMEILEKADPQQNKAALYICSDRQLKKEKNYEILHEVRQRYLDMKIYLVRFE